VNDWAAPGTQFAMISENDGRLAWRGRTERTKALYFLLMSMRHGGSAHPGRDIVPCTPSFCNICKVHMRPIRVDEESSRSSVANGFDQSHAAASRGPTQRDESFCNPQSPEVIASQW
jgi:hypothetical protein